MFLGGDVARCENKPLATSTFLIMEFKILPIFALLSVAIFVSDAALPSEEYWNSVLPNTPMPKAVQDLLHPTSEWVEDKRTSVNVGKGGVNSNSGGTNVNVGGGRVNVNAKNHTRVNVGGKGSGGGVTVRSHNRKGKPIYVGVTPGKNPFIYNYAATETQLHDDPNVALFFLEKDLYAANKMALHFSKGTNEATFLPRQIADKVPFSSNKLPLIYNKFSVKPDSDEAKAIKKTIQECEESGIKGEEKLCATSLESMVDFTTSKLGKDVDAVSTEADSAERKVYRIEAVRKKGGNEKAMVVCHKQEYAYAVFYCHKTETTVAYGVSLVGEGGSKAEAVAVCHRDTAEWNPKHLAFQVLKVKPGTVPVCHYLPEDHIVWVPKN